MAAPQRSSRGHAGPSECKPAAGRGSVVHIFASLVCAPDPWRLAADLRREPDAIPRGSASARARCRPVLPLRGGRFGHHHQQRPADYHPERHDHPQACRRLVRGRTDLARPVDWRRGSLHIPFRRNGALGGHQRRAQSQGQRVGHARQQVRLTDRGAECRPRVFTAGQHALDAVPPGDRRQGVDAVRRRLRRAVRGQDDVRRLFRQQRQEGDLRRRVSPRHECPRSQRWATYRGRRRRPRSRRRTPAEPVRLGAAPCRLAPPRRHERLSLAIPESDRLPAWRREIRDSSATARLNAAVQWLERFAGAAGE